MKHVHVNPEDVGLHNIDSSQLSASTASNSTLPPLELTDVEKAQNEEERKKRKAARKAKREARKKKKNEQQNLEHKKQRKEERRLKREARKKRREARKKKEEEAKAKNTSSSEISSSTKDRDDDESYQVTKGGKKENKGKGGANSNNKYAAVSFNYSSMSMPNHDQRSFINVLAGKLPHFDRTNFAKWKHLMRAYYRSSPQHLGGCLQ